MTSWVERVDNDDERADARDRYADIRRSWRDDNDDDDRCGRRSSRHDDDDRRGGYSRSSRR